MENPSQNPDVNEYRSHEATENMDEKAKENRAQRTNRKYEVNVPKI